MQAKAVTLEHIPTEILISILLLLNFKDMWNLSTTCKLWSKPFKEVLENKNFDDQLTHKWIDKIKAEITSEPPQFTGHKVPQYKKFYMDKMVEKPKLNKSILSAAGRNIQMLFLGAHFSGFSQKINSYSASGLDVQLSRLLANNPELTKDTYNAPGYRNYVLTCIENAIASGFNRIFDLHLAALKRSLSYDVSIRINSERMLHFAVQKANIYCVKVLLEHGGDPLKKTYSNQRTCYTFVLNLDSKHRNAIFKLLLDKTDKDRLKVDVSNLNSDEFQNEYRVSKSSMHLMLMQTQNDHLLASTDKDKVKADINDLTPDAFEKEYGVSKSSIDDTLEGTEPLNLGLKK